MNWLEAQKTQPLLASAYPNIFKISHRREQHRALARMHCVCKSIERERERERERETFKEL